MNEYEILYWLGGNKLKRTIKAQSFEDARYIFYMDVSADDIISISLVE